jgi:hypothetical protein
VQSIWWHCIAFYGPVSIKQIQIHSETFMEYSDLIKLSLLWVFHWRWRYDRYGWLNLVYITLLTLSIMLPLKLMAKWLNVILVANILSLTVQIWLYVSHRNMCTDKAITSASPAADIRDKDAWKWDQDWDRYHDIVSLVSTCNVWAACFIWIAKITASEDVWSRYRDSIKNYWANCDVIWQHS